ncbi:hypothetical protein Zmor_025906 [Zophobas morio]|uniref:Uncharacterized protein n=1 Tax=Zophobas morio TaxID=2755281 RepID=A0AA38HUD9_9CUCU|nr:hypothetical protein Zmor_025906 [Zophobas morio]
MDSEHLVVLTILNNARTQATSFCYRPVLAVFGVRSNAKVRTTTVKVAAATPTPISFAPQHERAVSRHNNKMVREAKDIILPIYNLVVGFGTRPA